jgi:ornithine carbamoyltransferase
MNETNDERIEQARIEYQKAVEEHDRILDKYVPCRPAHPGKERIVGEPFTQQAMKEIEEAENRMLEALKKFDKLLGI